MDMNDNTANNLSNVNTIGYKKGSIRFKDVMQSAVYSQEGSILRNDTSRYLGNLSCGSESMTYLHDFSQGALTKTANPYDVAIEGDGFFKIQDVDGKVSYTRNGSFTVNSDDYLVTKQGEYVLDVNNRRIRMIPEDFDPELFRDKKEIVIAENGNIEMNSYNMKIPMQTIGIWDFADKDDLFEIGDTKFVPKDLENNPELKSEKYSVQQGMLELSNSNVIKEMINTINTTRNYESLAKLVSTNSDMLSTAVSVGRIRTS
jgi:flagellar basal-body rod protein FlgG